MQTVWAALALWWLVLTLLGWLAWPLAAGLFRHTSSRGYGLARALGMILLAYALWLAPSLAPGLVGRLPPASLLWGLVSAGSLVSLAGWVRWRRELFHLLRCQWRHVLTVEALFVLVLVLYGLQRAYYPAITHTEQPMDFAFLNACWRSLGGGGAALTPLPPPDPWLSGYPISYYYGGYWSVAMLCRLTGLPTGVGYNLGLAHTLALTVVGGYGVLYDLLPQVSRRATHFLAVLGGLALGLASNLEGPLELARALGLGAPGLYRWLAVPGLATATTTPPSLLPEGVWWWRASRIITDQNILGRVSTVITEFPAFSFVLGDLHPHVTALPYVLLALGLALELYEAARGAAEPGIMPHSERRATNRIAGGETRCAPFGTRVSYLLLPILYGALGFLNTWDWPTFTGLAVLAFLLGCWQRAAAGLERPARFWLSRLGLMGGMVAVSLLAYLPFYRHLSSQAQGLGLVFYAKTPLRQYLLIWGLWLWPIALEAWLAWRRLRTSPVPGGRRRVLLGLWGSLLLLPWLGTLLLGGPGRFLLALITLFTAGPWLLLGLSGLLALQLADLWDKLRPARSEAVGGAPTRIGETPEGVFVRVLLVVGLGLTYVTEFLYLRDLFGTRMNTVFKFYYQAWVLLAIGGVWATWRLWRAGGWRRWVVGVEALLLCACLYYPLAASYTRAGGYRGSMTLDGTAYLQTESPAEYGAWRWLSTHATSGDVLAEGVGEDYMAAHNRLSAWTGIPTILGWPGHETQWRGNRVAVDQRRPDLETIYTDPQSERVLAALRRYGVTYLYVGPYEQAHYGIGVERLAWYGAFLRTVYAEGAVRLYAVPRD